MAPGRRNIRIVRGARKQFSTEQKNDALIELCLREGSAAIVAEQLGTTKRSFMHRNRVAQRKGRSTYGQI
ncbi:MAG: hypothetical protein GX020_03190 [Firmicutes bacterium]|nr:hypothetical protein [Bacillota bacterium]